MNEVTENRVITDLLKRGYRQIFEEQWPIMTGGIMIGILSIVTFAWGRPWGVVDGSETGPIGFPFRSAGMTRHLFLPCFPQIRS